MNIEELKAELKKYLSTDQNRFLHSIGTMNMCEELAKIYGADIERCKKAGLMHDMAKTLPNKEKLEYVRNNGIEASQTEILIPGILHGKIAADICKKKFEFDEEMCNAVAYHTTGRPNMSLMEKIVYVADTVEETRNYGDVEYYRNLAKKDIDQAMLEILDYVIDDNLKNGKLILEKSIETRNFILINRKK